LLFLVPLLLAYEAGVFWLGGTEPEALRNGADTWLRWGLEAFGLQQLYWAPALIVVVFLAWSWLRRLDRPDDLPGVWMGMLVEGSLFAVGLWILNRELGPLLQRLGVELTVAAENPAAGRIITYVGAGIYEEVMFRLLLFTGLIWVFSQVDLSPLLCTILAGVGSAALFAAAHHLGPYGEAFNGYVFLFRALAGLYFALLYQLRGFGIAVGAHICYDVLVGVLVE
jgi:hypothetical protein